MKSNDPRRTARIKAIHAACRSAELDDDARRAIQLEVTGKTSLADMTLTELGQVLDRLNKRGSGDNEWGFVFRLVPERQIHAKKIYRLAQRAGALLEPPVPVASKAYIEGITLQMRGTAQPLEFCDPEQLHKAVQSLEIFVKRHGV